jgi:hypothetical protein
MKFNYIPVLVLTFLFFFLENDLHSQYLKLEGKDLEVFHKEVKNETKNSTEILRLLELTIEDSKFAIENLKELKLMASNSSHIWFSEKKINVVVEKDLEKSEYALIKKWLFDHGIKILSNNRFFVTKTMSK